MFIARRAVLRRWIAGGRGGQQADIHLGRAGDHQNGGRELDCGGTDKDLFEIYAMLQRNPPRAVHKRVFFGILNRRLSQKLPTRHIAIAMHTPMSFRRRLRQQTGEIITENKIPHKISAHEYLKNETCTNPISRFLIR